jgi:hypothetical protein
MRGNNSAVECNLAKVEVAGSNPVSRSIFFSIMPDAPNQEIGILADTVHGHGHVIF